MANQEDLKFTVDSQLLGELGERLVTHNYVALAELIKNAYDADATDLIIRFINTKKENGSLGQSEIQLIDNGHGMTFEEVKDYWMRIATPGKRRYPLSPNFGRKKTGNKGVGRFACRRLAKKLIIETTSKIPNSCHYEFTQVVFNWKDFKPGTKLTDIPCKHLTGKRDDGKEGTILRLMEVSEFWSDHDFDLLRRQVLTLSTMGSTQRDNFKEDP
ncbi:MAG: ATP-binding protein, partial [Methanocella sp.]